MHIVYGIDNVGNGKRWDIIDPINDNQQSIANQNMTRKDDTGHNKKR